MRIPQILKSVFLEPFNLIALVAAGLVFAVSGEFGVLFGAAFVEAAYLIFTPGSEWYKKRYEEKLEQGHTAEREDLKNKLLPELTPEDRTRYERLRMAREAMDRTLDPRMRTELEEVLRKLDYLLDRFLIFAGKRVQYRRYLLAMQYPDQALTMEKRAERRRTLQPSGHGGWTPSLAEVEQILPQVRRKLDQRVSEISSEIEREQDATNKDVLIKNLQIVEKRRERIEQIGKIIVNLDRQLELTEDTFGLINDEIRARSPRQILDDVSEVVTQAELTTQILEAAAPFDERLEQLQEHIL
jgi:hypothetical protein